MMLPNNVMVTDTAIAEIQDDYSYGLFYGFYYNTFGNSCNNNTFGNGCFSNTLGNYCQSIMFNKDYCQFIIVENGNKNITITSTQTTSSNNVLRNITIAQGVNNTLTRDTISHNTVNDTFQTKYQNNNSQIINR